MVEFILEPKRKYSTSCPKCNEFRHKANTKSLTVYRDPDGFIRWQCNHAGQCEWNERQFMKDPNPQDVVQSTDSDTYSTTISKDLIASTKFDDPVYWYEDVAGNIVFGVMRKNLDKSKIYIPVRGLRYEDRLVWGKGITYPSGKHLFGAPSLAANSKVLVTEGEKAALAAQKLFPNIAVVTWRGGAQAVTNGDWALLAGKEVYLWPDNDEPGKQAMNKIAELIDDATVYMIDVSGLPPKSDLADDIPMADIVAAKKNAVQIKAPTSVKYSTFEEMLTRHDKKSERISTGWPEVDEEMNFPRAGIVVLEGRTKHGKSQMAINLMLNQLRKFKKVSFFSYEVDDASILARFARAMNYNIERRMEFQASEMEWLKGINGTLLHIYDQSLQLGLDALCKMLDDPSYANSFVVIDYAQIVPMPYGKDRYLLLKDLMDKLRIVAHKHGFLIMLLSQLTPNHDNPLYDAPREAKDIHFGAEMVLRVWYKANEFPHPAYEVVPGNYVLHVLLNRDGECGQQFGFVFHKGAYLEPNGNVVKGIKPIPKRDRVADALETLANLLQAKSISF